MRVLVRRVPVRRVPVRLLPFAVCWFFCPWGSCFRRFHSDLERLRWQFPWKESMAGRGGFRYPARLQTWIGSPGRAGEYHHGGFQRATAELVRKDPLHLHWMHFRPAGAGGGNVRTNRGRPGL